MSMITNFNPVQSINSFLKPFGLGVSSKQQIIAKTAMVAFAALTFNQMMMQTVNASIGMLHARTIAKVIAQVALI